MNKGGEIVRIARIRRCDKSEQTVKEHVEGVAKLCMQFAGKIGMPHMGKAVALKHDMGKAKQEFESYLRYSFENPDDKSLRGKVNHASAGAKYCFDNFFSTTDQYQKLTAQIISHIICSHHGGLIDVLDLSGRDCFSARVNPDSEIFYEESVNTFCSECFTAEQISKVISMAVEEVKAILPKLRKCINPLRFSVHLLIKYLFSCLIDADRFDSYKFDLNLSDIREVDVLELWHDFSEKLECCLYSLPKEKNIDKLRSEISYSCKEFAGKNGTGVYQLCVPTGGGKTLSSLRFALEHAIEYKKERIFYIIPYTTIIDQNAKDIKDILKNENEILEHHSNLIRDTEDEKYKLLTERWDSPIILTTMVQFLNTVFSGGTQNIRRMHNLANSVIIFDEIQALPVKCIHLFNGLINFLASICNSTIVLCSATQPLLSGTAKPLKLSDNPNIVTSVKENFRKFKRVKLYDKRIVGGYSTEQLADFILYQMESVNSVLAVFNTKTTAAEVFKTISQINKQLHEEEQYHIFHLSTNMCPAHRLDVLDKIKGKLGRCKVICVSTQMIEAGVNISFDCVIRALAGLDSIAQAAGRCNRHAEVDCRDVFVVNVKDENLAKLQDIKRGKECSERIFDEFKEDPERFDMDLLSPAAMNIYYQYYFNDPYVKAEMDYYLPKKNVYLFDLLDKNSIGVKAYESRNNKSKLMFHQAFMTAGDEFCVIEENTTGILVPHDDIGKDLILKINSDCDMNNLKKYLVQAQQYSVNLYQYQISKLEKLHAIYNLKNGNVIALRDNFYDENLGVVEEGRPMETLIIKV